MDDPEIIKAWAKTTLEKCIDDAILIKRVPQVKRDEILALVYSLVDNLYQHNDSAATFELRRDIRRRGGAVPFIGGYSDRGRSH